MEDEHGDGTPERVVLAIGVFIAGVIFLNSLNLDLYFEWPNFSRAPETKTEIVRRPPPIPSGPQSGPGETATLPPLTAQYVATGEQGPAHHNDPLERFEVVRGAHWVREEKLEDGLVQVHFSHIASGNWVAWSRSADGVREALTARFEAPPRGGRHTDMFFTNTGAVAVALGERCTIWVGDRARPEHRRRYTPFTTCITDDGIRLWSRGRDFEGNERVTSRLLTLERRAVSAEEEAPPAHLFQWSTWRGESEAAPAHNLSIDMSSPRVRNPNAIQQYDSEIVRERGAWRYVHSVDGGASESWTITSPHLFFSYVEGEFLQRTRELTVSRTPRPSGGTDHFVLLDPPRTETLAGIRCRWFDTAPGMHHGSASACISRDNLTLARGSFGDGAMGGNHAFSVRATRVSRDPLPASVMTPPARAFEWSR